MNDAFSAAHRAHATTAGLAAVLPAVAGFLMEKELTALDGLLAEPKRPFVVVLGGAKVTDKIKVIDRFLDLADQLLIGGAMSFAFLKAKGLCVGSLEGGGGRRRRWRRPPWRRRPAARCELVLPTDVVVADAFAEDAATQVVAADAIPDGWMGLDIGPETAAAYAAAIAEAGEVFWNGPMGVFEMAPFAAGTRAVAEAMAACSGRDGGGRRRLGGGRQQVRRGRQDGSRLHGRRGFARVHRGGGAAGSGRACRQGAGLMAAADADGPARECRSSPATGRCSRPAARAPRSCATLARRLGEVEGREVVVAPPFTGLYEAVKAAEGTGIIGGRPGRLLGVGGRLHRRGLGRACWPTWE